MITLNKLSLISLFSEGTETSRTSSVQQLNNVKGLGFNKVDEDLGITFKSSAQDTILTIADGATQTTANGVVTTALATGATGAFATADVSRIQISTTTPGLREILKSDFGNDFLEKVAWDSGSGSVDLRSLATLINLGFVAENSVAIVEDSTTDSRNWMALKEALKLVQRIERHKNASVTQSWLELLEKHDNSPSASAYKKISAGVHSFIISATLAAHLTDAQASTRNINDKTLTVFNYIAYESRHHEFNLDEDSNVVNSIDKLYPNDYYRKSFTANNLPNIYCAFHYFKKDDTALEYYKILNRVCGNFEKYYEIYTPKQTPKLSSMDVNHAIALLDSNMNNYTTNFGSFVHMKSKVQGWANPTDTWTETVPYYISNELKVGNYTQHGVFHYTENSFCEEMLCNMLK